MKAKFIFSLICVAALTLTACEEYPYGYNGYGYGYPYGGYYRPGAYLGYRIARRVAIHRARWR